MNQVCGPKLQPAPRSGGRNAKQQCRRNAPHALSLRLPRQQAESDDNTPLVRRESGEFEAAYSGSLTPRCLQAAISVLLSSSAMVIGPTPPGTGVMAPALG